jgi:hypothetical protein
VTRPWFSLKRLGKGAIPGSHGDRIVIGGVAVVVAAVNIKALAPAPLTTASFVVVLATLLLALAKTDGAVALAGARRTKISETL